MKRNIDLTLDGDFQKVKPVRRLNDIANRIRPNVNMRKPDIPKITDSEEKYNFLTGSFKSINDRKQTLKMYREVENREAACDRCGGWLLIKSYTICEKCEKEMDNQFIEEFTRRILSGTMR